MSLLTQRALRVFAVLEEYRAGASDILEALLPFFEPFLSDRTGTLMEPSELAEAINHAYRWHVTTDVVEELIPRFEAKGWVERRSSTSNSALYEITYTNDRKTNVSNTDIEVEQHLTNIAELFRTFIYDISPLTTISKTTEELSNLLIEWLVSIDAYTEEVLHQQTIHHTSNDNQLRLYSTLPDDTPLSSEDRYLCARFIKHLYDHNSPHIPALCKIASVGLLTEVIQDFRKPDSKVKGTDLNIYLDAPVALDLLGVSGKAAAENIRPVIEELQSIGGKVRIFRVSVGELQQALLAVLNRPVGERTGPTAEAIRRNEVLEAYVRQVARHPDNALAHRKVQIVERTLDQFPGEHEYFTHEEYESLFQKINWHLDTRPREHDATIVAFVLRMRRNTRSGDLFSTKHVLVTKNALLSELSKRFCRDVGLIGKTDIGPAVHQRQIATAIWLRTGLWDQAEEVPKRYVLAACERVLELNKGVVVKVRSEAQNLTPEKAEQLELLLTQGRSVQALMDKTLNVPSVVGPANIDDLLAVMRQSLFAEVQEEADRRIDCEVKKAKSQIRKAHGARLKTEKKIGKITASLKQQNAEDMNLVVTFLDEINSRIRKRRSIIKLSVATGIMFISSIPLITIKMSGWYEALFLAVGVAVTSVFLSRQVWDQPTGLSRRVEQWDYKFLEEMARQRGVSEKLSRFFVEYKDQKFMLLSGEDSENDSLNNDILTSLDVDER